MVHKVYMVWLFCLSALPAFGQRCGATDGLPIDRPGETTYTIPIAGYTNDDLAAADQSVCRVTVHFQHSYVYGLELTLFSPAGDSVQLIGPTTDQTRPPTTLARWFVEFGACGEPATPYPGSAARWNNNDAFDWPVFSVIQGAYQPAGGCLDDLSRGRVNGDWRLVVRNRRPGQQGNVSLLRIDFCDDRHLEGPCCDANAGEIDPTAPLTVGCEQSSDRLIVPPLRYRRPRPDSTEYGYAYLLTRNDSILALDAGVNLAGYARGAYEVCGLSYRLDQLDEISAIGATTVTDLRTELNNSSTPYCAQLTAECRVIQLLPPPDTVEIAPVICRAGYFAIGDRRLTDAGEYDVNLPSASGCDSIVRVTLSVQNFLRSNVDTSICASEEYALGSRLLTTPGVYVDTLESYFGCDSIATVSLDVKAEADTFLSAAICAGERYSAAGRIFTRTGGYKLSIPAANGCDSAIFVDLVVLAPEVRFAPGGLTLNCETDTVRLDASPSNFAFASEFAWYGPDGRLVSRSRSIAVTEPGRYSFELVAAAQNTSCKVMDTVVVTEDVFTPSAVITARSPVPCDGGEEPCDVLTCQRPLLQLRAEVIA